MAHSLSSCKLTNRVETCISTKLVIHQSIVVANSTIVILLSPVCIIVHFCTNSKECILILANLLNRKLLSAHSLSEDSLNLRICILLIIELLDTVVRKLATILCEEVVTLLKSINHILESSDGNTSYFAKLIDIFSIVWLLDVHSLVRTPCRNHLNLETTLASLLVVAKVVDWIICSTYALYIIMTHQTTSAKLWLQQFLVTLVINLTCCLWRKKLIDTESSLKLKVSPMIKRVAESIRYGLSPLLKLLPVRCILSCTETLINTISTHSTPLVVVATKPKLCDALKLVVVSNHLRNQMAMVIDDRHLSRMIVKQILCSLCIQQEVFIHKLFHVFFLF